MSLSFYRERKKKRPMCLENNEKRWYEWVIGDVRSRVKVRL